MEARIEGIQFGAWGPPRVPGAGEASEVMASLAQPVAMEWNPGAGALRQWSWPGKAGRLGLAGRPLDPDSTLVERCLAGEEPAWEEMAKTHTRRVYAMCYRFTGSDGQAQDLTQEVFLRVFRSLKSFRAGEGSFATWLAKLTRNLLIDNYRRTKLERVTDSIEDQLPVLEQEDRAGGRADTLLSGREASEILQWGLRKLSPELRETVILRDLEGMEYREIAGVLNVPEGTVKSRLNRGRSDLARVLRRHKVSI